MLREKEEIISIAEALQREKIAQIADLITQKKGIVHLVLIAGPSSSGKTTFARRLYIQLRVNGWHPITISLDDYFRSRGEINEEDYEKPEALDLILFEEQIKALIRGEEVEIPRYNFITGTRRTPRDKNSALSPMVFNSRRITRFLNPQLEKNISEEKNSKFM